MIKMTFEAITPVLLRRGVIERNGKKYYYSDLSGQTFRGLLRWWFRFFALSCYSAQEVLKFEKILFGSSGEEGIGASPIAIIPKIDENQKENWSKYASQLPAYFSGFRFNPGGKIFDVIPPGKEIKVYLVWQMTPKHLINNEKKLIEKYENLKGVIFEIYTLLLAAISVCGGIGAAWRRGLGSIQLKEYDLNSITDGKLKELLEGAKVGSSTFSNNKNLKKWMGDIQEKIKDTLKDLKGEEKESARIIFPCYSANKILIKHFTEDSWQKALEKLTYPRLPAKDEKKMIVKIERRESNQVREYYIEKTLKEIWNKKKNKKEKKEILIERGGKEYTPRDFFRFWGRNGGKNAKKEVWKEPFTVLWRIRRVLHDTYYEEKNKVESLGILRVVLGYPLRDIKKKTAKVLLTEIRLMEFDRIPSPLILTVKNGSDGKFRGFGLVADYYGNKDLSNKVSELKKYVEEAFDFVKNVKIEYYK